MKKLFDLRFVIGAFFAIVGSLLVIYHFVGASADKAATPVNIWCGILFILFGAGMIALSYLQKLEDD